MSEHEENLARLRAEMDQAREGMKTIAQAAWALYSESVEQGFNTAQAFDLVQAWIVAMVSPGSAEDA